MFRTVFAPLFVVLLALIVGEAILIRRWRSLTRPERGACVLLTITTATLAIASLPIVANLVLYSLERQYRAPTSEELARASAVVVLDGGYVRGKDSTHDRLGSATTRRVLCAVDGFQRSRAQWLIMTGRGRSAELMRDLAVQLGAATAQILLESASQTTFEHPKNVGQLGSIGNSKTIVVVTDAYHIPRAMGEFKRYFPKVIALPCDGHPAPMLAPKQFLPQAAALSRTTSTLQEYLGMAWYGLRHLAD